MEDLSKLKDAISVESSSSAANLSLSDYQELQELKVLEQCIYLDSFEMDFVNSVPKAVSLFMDAIYGWEAKHYKPSQVQFCKKNL